MVKYKEFKIFGKLFVRSGFGLHMINENGDFGFRIWRDAISIKKGNTERFYYFKKIKKEEKWKD